MSHTLYAGTLHLSTWSVRAVLPLWQSGLDANIEIIPLYVDDPQPLLHSVAPAGLVPFLNWDGLKIWDSLAIAEFLAEQAPAAGLWPHDPGMRAIARSVTAEMHSGFQALRNDCPGDIGARKPTPPITPALKKNIDRVTTIWSSMRDAHGGPYLFGDFGIADAFYAPVVTRFQTYDLPIEGLAKAYMDAVLDHPLMRRLVAEAAKGRQNHPHA